MNLATRTPFLAFCLLFLVSNLTFGAEFLPLGEETVDLAGAPYLAASGTLVGEFDRVDGTMGTFEVPAQALFPLAGCNGTALVDVVNSVLFEFPPTVELGHLVIPFGRLLLGDDLIAGRDTREGFTYLAVQWNKLVTDETGVGMIERGTDGWEILAGAADFLRDEDEDSDGSRACEIDHVLAFGWSQTGKLLAELLTSGKNERSSGRIFDGMFLGVAGGRCRSLSDEAFPWSYHDCDEPPADHVPTVAYNTESEVQLAFGAGALRTPTSSFSVYDHAGVAHIDAQFLPFAVIFADLADALGVEFVQNPISVVPGVRAAFWALHSRVSDGRRLPRSQLLHAEPVATSPVQFIDRRGDASLLTWSGGAVYSADADGDGVADGGVRMPHMPTIARGGRVIGAPLGSYGGIDFRFAGGPGIFFANGGTFVPFSEAELATLYPNHGTYVQRVARAVIRLVVGRYLLPEDGLELIDAAVQSDVGR